MFGLSCSLIIITNKLTIFVSLLMCYVQQVVKVDVLEDLGKVMEELLHADVLVWIEYATYLS